MHGQELQVLSATANDATRLWSESPSLKPNHSFSTRVMLTLFIKWNRRCMRHLFHGSVLYSHRLHSCYKQSDWPSACSVLANSNSYILVMLRLWNIGDRFLSTWPNLSALILESRKPLYEASTMLKGAVGVSIFSCSFYHPLYMNWQGTILCYGRGHRGSL